MNDKYFIIELTDDVTFFDEDRDRLRLNMDEYQEFIQTAKELDLLDYLLKKIDFVCPKCKGFTIPAVAFYETVLDRIDLECVYEMIHRVTEKVYLSEEEWIKYSNYGREGVEIIKSDTVVEAEGEIYRFVAEEIFFQLDPDCDCSRSSEPFSEG